MNRTSVFFVTCLCLCAAYSETLFAGEASGTATPGRNKAGLLPERASVTHHSIEVSGTLLKYTARAGTMEIQPQNSKTRGRLFYIAYTRDDINRDNWPVTFVFNGGPGAASTYLHLLALGPKIITLGDDGTIPPPPARMADNAFTWLTFTDLVFVDPVGTGYSQALRSQVDKKNSSDSEDDASEKAFWSLRKDLDSIGEFIRLYLTQAERWHSPKFLVGESYGGFRAAALPKRLASTPGLRLNGIVLVSPVLEFSYQQFDTYRLQPWISLLPAYAVAAFHHGKSSIEEPTGDILVETEEFATGEYLTWLARGGPPDGEDVITKLVRYLGLSRELVIRYRGRVPRTVFAKKLLRESGRIISLYDATIASIDPFPGSSRAPRDPVLEALTAPLASAFNAYVRTDLQYQTDRAYRVLNSTVSRNWEWNSEGSAGRSALGTADGLKEAMSLNSNLKVFIAHGIYDLVTPYLSTKLVLRQMALDRALGSKLTFKTYAGGHMLYTHASVRAAFQRDARTFYSNAAVHAD